MTTKSLASNRSGGVRARIGAMIRGTLAIGLAGVVTFGLFIFMQALIRTDAVAVAERPELPELVMGQIPDDIGDERVIRDFDVEPVDPPPARPRLEPVEHGLPDEGPGFRMDPPPVEVNAQLTATNFNMPPPLTTRVAPVYPAREARNEVEGECTISYDILANGSTANPRVESCDSRGFERATLDAIAQWRHSPVSDRPGDSVVRRVSTTLIYELQD